MITAITCTGDRPLCLKFLARWMDHQIVKPDQWLIIDDGQVGFKPDVKCDYIRRIPKKEENTHTLLINLEEALPHVKGDIILFMEDDEYYAPKYIQILTEKIKGHEMAGLCKSKYYNLPARRYHIHPNLTHASLAQTGIVKELLPTMKSLLAGDPYLDIRLWDSIRTKNDNPGINLRMITPFKEIKVGNGRGVLFDDGINDCLYVGMKGMPGRKGIGSGHLANFGRTDVGGQLLRKWIPDHYKDYLSIPYKDLNIGRASARSTGRRECI